MRIIRITRIKELLIALFIIWITTTGVSIVYTFTVITHLDFGDPTKVQINEFDAERYGDPCVGDTIQIFAEISNIYNDWVTIDVVIKEQIDNQESTICNRTIRINSYDSRRIEQNYILMKGGESKFSLFYTVDDIEYFGGSFSLKAKSYKEDTHFIVTYYHFNVQYSCGDQVSEANIINASIRNLLEFYYENAEYKFTFEIQGYGIELIARDYPDILDVIRALTERGQMELVVTHYSDQYFLAYPELDLRKSIEISDDILKENGLRRSNVFGTQEWQWSPMLPEIMQDYGYNIFIGVDHYFRKYADLNEPWSNWRGKYEEKCVWDTEWNGNNVYIVLDGESVIDASDKDAEKNTKTLYYEWAFTGDGEMLNTDCYANNFDFIEDKQREFENDLEKYKEDDYEFITISELVYTALEKGLGTHELDTIPCTARGENLRIWSGLKKNDYEKDTYINTLRYEARTSLLALETVIDDAEEHNLNVKDEKNLLNDLWKELLLSEVTDSTGRTPGETEVQYSIDKATNIIITCKEIAHTLLEELDMEPNVLIDTKKDTIYEDFQLPIYEEVESPLSFNVSHDDYSYSCYKYCESLYMLEISVNSPNDSKIMFNTVIDEMCYSPLATNDYVFLEKFADEYPHLMLANGWVYLGNKTSLINICTARHAPMTVNDTSVYFRNIEETETMMYRFLIYFGAKNDALEFANRLNIFPCVLSEDITTVILTEEMISDFVDV